MYLVSVDGGATKTFALCYKDDGTVLSVGAGGPSNFRNIGIEKTKKNILYAIKKCTDRAMIKTSEVSMYSFALAGVKDSQKSTEIIESFLKKLNLKSKINLYNDGEAGFNCRFPGKDGIVVAPGTGMIAYGRNGELFERSSGWGWFIGDEGGAFYISRMAIQYSAKIFDGRENIKSNIPDALLSFFNVKEPRQLVNEIYTNPINVRKIASFARIVSEYAKKGDELSISILKESAKEAAKSVISLKNRLFPDIKNVQFSGYGGVFRAGDIYIETLKNEVLEKFPEMDFIPPLFGYHAVIGSMYLTLKSIDKQSYFDLNATINSINAEINKLSNTEKKDYLLL